MWLAENFHHCPKCGSPGLKGKKGKSFECPDCGFHFYLNPAAAAAGLILSERRPGEVLLIRRAKEPKRGKLALVGGFVDQGEEQVGLPSETWEGRSRAGVLWRHIAPGERASAESAIRQTRGT